MKAVFLGTSGSVPTKDAGLPAVAVHAHEWMLFDCGEGTQRQMMKYKVPYGSVNAVFISHLHLDHYLGLYGYMETLRMSNRYYPIKIFVPPGFRRLNLPDFVEIVRLYEGKIYENKEFEVFAFKVEHSTEAYGFKVCRKKRRRFDTVKSNKLGLRGVMFKEILEKGKIEVNGSIVKLDDVSKEVVGPCLVYTGDTRPCESTINNSKEVDVLIHESMFLDELKELAVERMHSTALEAGEVAKSAKVKKLILTHISPRYKDRKVIEEEARKVFGNVFVSYDGMVVEV